jgi:hypothetical protein
VSASADRPAPNAIASALGLLGDEWTLLILRAAFEGAHRYGDWKLALPVSDAVLTATGSAVAASSCGASCSPSGTGSSTTPTARPTASRACGTPPAATTSAP